MNKRYKKCPEFLANVRFVNKDGDDSNHADKVAAIQVFADKERPEGFAQIEVRELMGKCLVVEIELPELIAALSLATLNADHD
jgi:hypothetical protein